MARIPKLDSAGKFLAADVNAQIDARTKATMRADLPALAEELKIGGGSGSGIEEVSGTVTLDAADGAIRQVYATASATVQGESLAVGEMAMFRHFGGVWQVIVFDDMGVPRNTTWRAAGTTPGAAAPAPTIGTGAISSITGEGATLTVTGATNVAATGYSFSPDDGATWSTWQAEPVYVFTGMNPKREQVVRWRVRNTDGVIVASKPTLFTTADADVYPDWTIYETFNRPDGTRLVGLTTEKGGKVYGPANTMLKIAGVNVQVFNHEMTGDTTPGQGVSFDVGAGNVEVEVDYALAPQVDARIYIGALKSGNLDGAPGMMFMLLGSGVMATYDQNTASGNTAGWATSGTLNLRASGGTIMVKDSAGKTATFTANVGGTIWGFGARGSATSVAHVTAVRVRAL